MTSEATGQDVIDALRCRFPGCNERQYMDLLIGRTCWPFGTHKQVLNQLLTLADKANGYEQAMEIGAREFDRQWNDAHPRGARPDKEAP